MAAAVNGVTDTSPVLSSHPSQQAAALLRWFHFNLDLILFGRFELLVCWQLAVETVEVWQLLHVEQRSTACGWAAARSTPLETENQSFRKRRWGVTRLIEIIRFYYSILFYRAQLYCTPSIPFLKSSSGGGENLQSGTFDNPRCLVWEQLAPELRVEC